MSKDEYLEKMNLFLEELRLDEKSTRTITQYKNQLSKFIDYISNKELNQDLLIKYKSNLDSLNYAISSRNLNIIIVNKFIKWLGYNNLHLKQFRSQLKTSIENISSADHKRMLRTAKKNNMMDMYLIIKIFAYTGIRVEELNSFTVENVKQSIWNAVNKGKERQIILRNDLKRELLNYCKENNITSGIIFKSKRKPEQMINVATVWKRLKKIAGMARVNKKLIHPHAWRHLFAVYCIEELGLELSEVADILGHAKMDTTRLYSRTSAKHKQKMLEKIKY